MVRLASLMRSAISRRTPMTLISEVSAETSAPLRAPVAAAADCAGFAARPAVGRPSAAARSARRMRPPGPDPATDDKSMPASCARRRLAGDVITRPVRAAESAELFAGALGTAAPVLEGTAAVPDGTDPAPDAAAPLGATPVLATV